MGAVDKTVVAAEVKVQIYVLLFFLSFPSKLGNNANESCRPGVKCGPAGMTYADVRILYM